MKRLTGSASCSTRARPFLLLMSLAAILTPTACDSSEVEDDVIDVTVLVAFTSAVADSVDDVRRFVATSFLETNRTYRASGIGLRLVPVHVTEVEYRMGDRLRDLERLLDREDGQLGHLHALRDEHEADLVVLVAEERNATINASILATEETAFAIVWWASLGAPLYGLAHEVGHLQGARHALLTDPTQEPFPYGHGFRNDSLRTIMAGGPARLVPRFSGPDQVHDGVVLGDSTTADVARVLRETAIYISNFRGTRTPTDFVPRGTWPTLTN